MDGSGRKDRTAQPLRGAVICCTSVPAEQRTLYADWALSMGADHKLDLTSDVTHLLVGDTDTPKYKYVAREREDVKVLRPEWIEAVRNAYMADEDINMNALEVQYKLPTLAGLTICITGFDDLSFRAGLQHRIDEEGGSYTGDLTKNVTHLIAAFPEGKKYQYAMQWQKKVVTLKWFKDSLDRKMQLDESRYLHSIPAEDQGKGAWNRDAKYANQLGKRPRPQESTAEPSRKLRRTASAKFSSQNDELWADIKGKAGVDQPGREPLRPSKSMPAIRPDRVSQDLTADRPELDFALPLPRTAVISHGYMDGSYFFLDQFDRRKNGILRDVLLGQGATVLDDINDLYAIHYVDAGRIFLVVPHNSKHTTATETAKKSGRCQLVTEFFIEICMDRKQCVDPSTYPLGNILPPVAAFQGLSINSSGFPGIERNHIAKVVQALGATYNEVMKPGLSLLICHTAKSSIEKMTHAKKWGVAVVTVDWLWECLSSGSALPSDKYSFRSIHIQGQSEPVREQTRAFVRDSFANDDRTVEAVQAKLTKHYPDEVPTQPLLRKTNTEDAAETQRPGSDFVDARAEHYDDHRDPTPNKDHIDRPAGAHAQTSTEANQTSLERDLPLKETTGNSPPKARSSSPKKRKPLFCTLNGASSVSEINQQDSGLETAPHPASRPQQDPQGAGILNGAIQELLNQKSRQRSANPPALNGCTSKQPLSRALSNVSNTSIASRARASRAGSVSSVNTDGLGSEIAMEPAEPGRAASSSRGRGSFTGRAKARDDSQHALQKPPSIELNDPDLYREGFAEEEVAPQLTQLGYEDPEEAIALRAKLAEKRRKKSRAGQEDPNPKEPPHDKTRLERRIRDDDFMLDAKWAGGRRTRHKDKTPPSLKGWHDF